jgi:hypothetical protein
MSTENLEIDLRNSQDIKIGAFFLPSDEPHRVNLSLETKHPI